MPEEAAASSGLETPAGFRSGFVSILGRPNTGKSTLLNELMGTKLAIVSNKPQTTRTLIQGVLTLPEAQIVIVDTPGIHQPDSLFNRRMMEAIREALDQRDLLLFLADSTVPFSDADRDAVEMVRRSRTPALLLLNKIDRMKHKSQLLPLIDQYRALFEFSEYIPISALTGEGLETVRTQIIIRLPHGPAYFPPDHITDQPERFLAAELIREKILHETRGEVPHSVAVLVDRWEETAKITPMKLKAQIPGLRPGPAANSPGRGPGARQGRAPQYHPSLPPEGRWITRIAATIYVEREGQKGIVIGAKGSVLKKVGTMAREEIEALLGRKVFVELYVKVRPRWRESAQFLNELDWRSMAGGEAVRPASGAESE